MPGLPHPLSNLDAIAEAWRAVNESDRLAMRPGAEGRDERESHLRLYGQVGSWRRGQNVSEKAAVGQ